MAVTAQLNGVITLTDNSTGAIQLQKTVALSYSGTETSFGSQVLIGASPVTIPLPVSPTQFLYIKNLSTTATVTATWSPNGGISNPVLVLQPLAGIIFSEPNTVSGITTLTLTASVASTPVEFILLG